LKRSAARQTIVNRNSYSKPTDRRYPLRRHAAAQKPAVTTTPTMEITTVQVVVTNFRGPREFIVQYAQKRRLASPLRRNHRPFCFGFFSYLCVFTPLRDA
jgi:hypothetical protein